MRNPEMIQFNERGKALVKLTGGLGGRPAGIGGVVSTFGTKELVTLRTGLQRLFRPACEHPARIQTNPALTKSVAPQLWLPLRLRRCPSALWWYRCNPQTSCPLQIPRHCKLQVNSRICFHSAFLISM